MDLTVFEKIEKDISKRNLVQPKDKILAMVSGGRDSVFLLHFLSYLRNKIGIEIYVFHLNHLIRGEEADRDEKFVVGLAKQFGFPFYIKRIDIKRIVSKKGGNIEAVAREIRYNEAEKLRVVLNCDLIATAHTKTDFFETIIMHLARGDSVFGLLGIGYGNGKIIRPVLSVNRGEITEFLRKNSINWVDDSTNSEESYTRNYVRARIAPHFENIGGKNYDDRVMKSVMVLRDYVITAKNFINRDIRNIVKIENNKLHLDLMKFFHYNGEERRLIIVKMLELLDIDHSRNMVEAVEDFFVRDSSFYDYNGVFRIAVNIDEAVFWKDVDYYMKMSIGEKIKTDYFTIQSTLCKKFRFSDSKTVFYFPVKELSFPVTVRKYNQGDRMIPFGSGSPKKLKDVFNGEKIPVWKRDEYPVVVSGKEIIAILGVRRSALFPLKKGEECVKFEYVKVGSD